MLSGQLNYLSVFDEKGVSIIIRPKKDSIGLYIDFRNRQKTDDCPKLLLTGFF